MSKRNDGDNAFPMTPADQVPGMSLRDWFAGQALVGILGCYRDLRGYDRDTAGRVKAAYNFADEMIRQRAEWYGNA